MAKGMSKRFKWSYTKQQLKEGAAPEIKTELLDTENISIADDLGIPVYSSDGDAPNSCLYYNSTDEIFKYKDGAGNVHVGGGVSDFLGLSDTPSAYTGDAGKVATVNATEDALVFEAGAASFPALYNVISKTAAYTAASGDVVLADASGGAFTVTLPTPGEGKKVNVKKIDSSANAVTVSQNGTETIDGDATVDITTEYENLTVVSDGTDWYII